MDGKYVLRRSGQGVVTVVAVVTITFAMIRMLPGGPGVFQCITGGSTGGSMSSECQAILADAGSAGLPLADLAVLGGLVIGLVIVSAALWKGH